MKQSILLLLLPISLLRYSFIGLPPVNYSVDPVTSTIKWTGYAEAGGYSPSGSVKVKSGTIALDGTSLVSGKLVIDMRSISQQNKDLEKHLRNTDFFDCEKFPEASFVIGSVKANLATGTLTIKGITQQVSCPVTISRNENTNLVKASLRIDRTRFGIKYNSKSYFQDLGSYAIKNDFDLELNLVFK